MQRTKVRRCGQQDHVHLIDHVLVGIEAHVLAFLGNVDTVRDVRLALERLELVGQLVGKGIRQCNQLHVEICTQGIGGCTTASASAAHQTDLERFLAVRG